MASKIKTAAIIVIGNEILSGRTQDKNINYIAKKLFVNGITLEFVCVIPDNKKIIMKNIRSLKQTYDFIFTTGGIGPTHDDITSESISAALNLEYKIHNGALNELIKYYKKVNSELTDARKKMAYMTKGSKLIINKVSGAPGFKIENIFVLAGIPSIVTAMMDEILKMIKNKNKFYSVSIFTELFESKIANILEKTEKIFFNTKIGSYPIFDGKPKGVEIVITSLKSKKEVQLARNFINRELNKII